MSKDRKSDYWVGSTEERERERWDEEHSGSAASGVTHKSTEGAVWTEKWAYDAA